MNAELEAVSWLHLKYRSNSLLFDCCVQFIFYFLDFS